MGETIVKSDSREGAMKKLNAYLATNPDGGYTALPCKSVDYVYPLNYLD